MGMNLLRRSCYTNSTAPAPSPSLFTVIQVTEVGSLFVSMIRYHNATNMEGKKCLVTTFDPRKRKIVDPHFSESRAVLARMLPTDAGYESAVEYAKMIQKRKK